MDKAKLFKENGGPRFLKCFESKRAEAIDRFTIVFTRARQFMGNKEDWLNRVYYVSANGVPDDPAAGFYQHGEAPLRQFRPCGSRISFSALPERLRRTVLNEYRELWGV